MRKLIWLVPLLLALLVVGLCLELTNAKGMPIGKTTITDGDDHPWDNSKVYRIDTLAVTQDYVILRIWTSPDSSYIVTVPRPSGRGGNDFGKKTRTPIRDR